MNSFQFIDESAIFSTSLETYHKRFNKTPLILLPSKSKDSFKNDKPLRISFSDPLEENFKKVEFAFMENYSNMNKKISMENVKKEKKKKSRFEKLLNSLEKIIKGEELKISDLNLDDMSLDLFYSVLSRKLGQRDFRKKFNNATEERSSEATEFINLMVKLQKPKKRAEERCKFIFKMTVNNFRENFFENNNLKKKDAESEKKFWKFYFGTYCDKKKIPLSYVFDPLNNKLAKNEKFKCLNIDYLKLVFRNKRFKEACFTYIRQNLVEEYFLKINKKFKKLFYDFERAVEKKSGIGVRELVKVFVEKKINGRGCKLPWTVNEIDNAKDYFLQYIQKLTHQQNN